MGSICLAQAVNLRCFAFNKEIYIGLAAPTFVEFLLSFVLVFSVKESARSVESFDLYVSAMHSLTDECRDWLIVTESWIYTALTIADLVSHIVPAVESSIVTFRAIDTVVGMPSFPPLSTYTTHVQRQEHFLFSL